MANSIYMYLQRVAYIHLVYNKTHIKFTGEVVPLHKMRVRLWPCKTDLSLPVIFITDRSKAILLWCLFLFYVFVLNFCVVSTLCAFSNF